MKQILQVIFFLVLVILNTSCCYSKSIILKNESMTPGGKIYLRDITENCNEEFCNVEIGASPLPSKSRILSKNYIERKLKQNKISVELIGEENIKIWTKFSKIKIDELREHIKNYIMEKHKDIKITPIGFIQDIITPYGKVEYKIDNNFDITNFSIVPVKIFVDGKLYKTIKLHFNIDRFEEIYVAKRNILKGSIIKEDDFEKKLVSLNTVPKDVLTFVSFGKLIAKQTILSGYPLRKINVKTKLPCNKNDIITIVGKIGVLEIKTEGRALQDGNIGDIVKVITPTKKEFLVRIIDEKLGEVNIQ